MFKRTMAGLVIFAVAGFCLSCSIVHDQEGLVLPDGKDIIIHGVRPDGYTFAETLNMGLEQWNYNVKRENKVLAYICLKYVSELKIGDKITRRTFYPPNNKWTFAFNINWPEREGYIVEREPDYKIKQSYCYLTRGNSWEIEKKEIDDIWPRVHIKHAVTTEGEDVVGKCGYYNFGDEIVLKAIYTSSVSEEDWETDIANYKGHMAWKVKLIAIIDIFEADESGHIDFNKPIRKNN